MISNYPESSANIWVDRYGTWHLVGTGVSWHAGRVKPGMPDNFSSIGIETDHTTAELWPPAQIDSLRKGTAAIFKKQGVGSDWLHFHKTICTPVGRKSDPDGLDLGPERQRVANFMTGSSPAPKPPVTPPKPPTPAKEWDEMATKAEIAAVVKAELNQYFANGEGNPTNGRIVQACKNATHDRLGFWLPRTLNVLMNGQGNQAYPAGSTLALDGKGLGVAGADHVWNEVMPPHADGKSPEKAVAGAKARDSIAGILSTVMRILN
jgi:hypothetical protein